MKASEFTPAEAQGPSFEPDTLLPVQFAGRVGSRRSQVGEFRLMNAILEDAVDMYRKHADADRGRKLDLFAEAEAWIESTDHEWVFSFENICDMLDLDAGCLRAGLRAHKARMREAGRASVVPIRPDVESEPLLRSAGSQR
jgi:hypothetical protein